MVIFGMTVAGRCLALLATESALTSGWHVIAGRDLDADELGMFAVSTGMRA